MTEAAINSAMASVREVQDALLQLKKDLGIEADEEALRKCIETIEAAETMTQGLVVFLQSRNAPAVDPASGNT